MTRILTRFVGPYMVFMPNYWVDEPQVTWWLYSPAIIRKLVAALGFERSRVIFHKQLLKGQEMEMYTVVGERTQPMKRVAAPSVTG